MAKRVHELAREFGVQSKDVLSTLKDMGEYVKSASSTVEPPVVRRLNEEFGESLRQLAAEKATTKTAPKSGSAKAGSNSTTKAAGSSKAPAAADGSVAAEIPVVAEAAGAAEADTSTAASDSSSLKPADTDSPSTEPVSTEPASTGPDSLASDGTESADVEPVGTESADPAAATDEIAGSPQADREVPKPGPKPGPKAVPKPGPPAGAKHPAKPDSKSAPESSAPQPGARPGPSGGKDEGSSEAPAARAPKPGPKPGPRGGGARPGNNPFSTTQGMQRPPAPAAREGGGSGNRGGMPRPNPAMMPKQSKLTNRDSGPSRGDSNRTGGRGAPARSGGGGGAGGRGAPAKRGAPPSGTGPARPGPGRGGRGGTQGAFGRPGGPTRRGRKSKRAKRQEFDQMQAPSIGGVRLRKGNGEPVRLARGASLTDFAEKVGADAASLVQVLFHLGEMVTATQSVNDETLQILGEELNYDVQVVSPEDEDRELLESFDLEFGEDSGKDADLVARPPVVTVMGHVDHGKTKLLDALRESNTAGKEAGGITQTIGAYQVGTHVDDVERRITFIDTPGHEAFTAMRARGAHATDIAVLVVAADDGVMPQTIEALNHAKAAEVPIVVAINKVDKPDADSSKARGQLTEYGLVPEEYGGDAMFVDVSAKAGTGLDGLLESIVLTADAALDLRANPEQNAEGLAIEAHLDRGRGPVATVLVQRGTLSVGDAIVAGPAHGRVRALLDERGESVDHASPSRPVLVLGLTAVPGAGDNFMAVDDDRVARQVAEKREARERNALLAQRSGRRTLEDFMSSSDTDELLLIIKGDGSGSVEALENALAQIDVGENVALRVIDRGVGAITETNVMLAAASNAVIIGFNVRGQGKAAEMADREGVEIKYYSVIYQAIDEIEGALKGMLKPIYEEVQLGHAQIREIFRSSKAGNIAGCMVSDGIIRRNAKARVMRDSAVVADNLQIGSLRREKDDVTEVRDGFECGITLKGFNDINIGDVIETFELREKARE